MRNKVEPFNTFIYGFKKICNNLPEKILYVYDLFSESILFVLTEIDGLIEYTAFMHYIREILINNEVIDVESKFYTNNSKLIGFSNKFNNISEIYKDILISKREVHNVLESITYLFRDQIIPRIENLSKSKGKLTRIEISVQIYLFQIQYNLFSKKKRLNKDTYSNFFIKSEINIMKDNFFNILSAPPIFLNINTTFITKMNKNIDSFNFIHNFYNYHILKIRKLAIEALELEKKDKLLQYNSDKTNKKIIPELISIFDKELIISKDKKEQMKYIMNKLKMLKKMGMWEEAILIFKDILKNFKKRAYGSEIDRIKLLLLYSTLLMNKMSYTEAIKKLKLTIFYAKKNNYSEGILEAFIQLSHTNFNLKNNSTARIYLNKIKVLSKKIKIENKYSLLKLYNLDIVIYFEEKNYNKAIDVAKNYLKLAKEIGDVDKIYHGYCNLSMLYNINGNRKKALSFANKQIRIANRENSDIKLMESFGNLGNIYNLMENLKSARTNCFVALDYVVLVYYNQMYNYYA